MKQTPYSNRKKIVLWGETNVGKSSLLNALTEQRAAIVSDQPGTTTDPVRKAMELLDLGAVLFVDTAGMNDQTPLGQEREGRTMREVETADLVLLVCDSACRNDSFETQSEILLNELAMPYIKVLTKVDLLPVERFEELRKDVSSVLGVSMKDAHLVSELRAQILSQLQNQEPERTLLQGLDFPHRKLMMVVPLDGEAPKGRLILPQVQLLREALDQGLQVVVVRDLEAKEAMDQSPDLDLVVCDSQVFAQTYALNDRRFPMTSFSILFARQKGAIESLMEGAKHILLLSEGARVLVAETCTHTTSHEDIGRVKIPKMLERLTGKRFDYHFSFGMDYPDDLHSFDLIIHCGGCMLTRKQMIRRQEQARGQGVPVTNYGLTIALCSGILDKVVV